MLEIRVRWICLHGFQREMIEQMSASQVCGCLRDYFGAFHILAVPEGRSVLLYLGELVLHT